MVYGCILVTFGATAVAASLAELASMLVFMIINSLSMRLLWTEIPQLELNIVGRLTLRHSLRSFSVSCKVMIWAKFGNYQFNMVQVG
jgi:hypothetical protein